MTPLYPPVWKCLLVAVLGMGCRVGWAADLPTTSSLDFGVVRPDTTNKLSIHILNDGNHPLGLKSVEPSCPLCTHVTLMPQTLAPGQAIDVPVVFTPSKNDGGRLRRTVTFQTDDLEHPAIMVGLDAYVTSVAGAWPAEIAIGTPQPPGTDIPFAFEVVNVSDKPLTPLYATGPLDGPKLTVPRDAIAPGGKARVTGIWHFPAKAGAATGELVLYVDHPALAKITIPYQGVVAESKGATPTTGPASSQPGVQGPTTMLNQSATLGSASIDVTGPLAGVGEYTV